MELDRGRGAPGPPAAVKPGAAAMEFMKAAGEDAYDRLIYPSLEREVRGALTERADEGAIASSP